MNYSLRTNAYKLHASLGYRGKDRENDNCHDMTISKWFFTNYNATYLYMRCTKIFFMVFWHGISMMSFQKLDYFNWVDRQSLIDMMPMTYLLYWYDGKLMGQIRHLPTTTFHTKQLYTYHLLPLSLLSQYNSDINNKRYNKTFMKRFVKWATIRKLNVKFLPSFDKFVMEFSCK